MTWDELPDVELADFTIATVPARYAEIGDPHAALDDTRRAASTCCSSRPGATRRPGCPTRPWPPNFAKQAGEARRVAPSRRRAD